MKRKVVKTAMMALLLVNVLIFTNCGDESKADKKENVVKETEQKADVNSTSEITGSDETDTTNVLEETTTTTESSSIAPETETTGNNSTENTTTTTGQTTSTNTTTNTTESTQTNQSSATGNTTEQETTTSQQKEDDELNASLEMRNLTTAQIVKDMGIGINLGNTLESCGDWISQWNSNPSVTDYETAWGSPVITKAMIQGVADEGFGVLRIPVAWSNMMDESYNIDSAYIERVREITDWAIESGMYVIVNIHYDGGWWENFPTDKTNCMAKYKAIWTQLAEAFKGYGDKLVFESLNEEGCWDSVWNRYSGSATGKSEAYGILNEINQTFVDIVRESGGNNKYRHLLIAGYATDIDLTCDSCFKMPADPQGRCAVSVHYYTPFAYTHLEKDESWASVQTEWGSAADIAELNNYMKKMYDNFVSKGVPVIIGEFGVPTMSNKTKENAIYYMESVAKAAYDYGMCPVLWDATGDYSYYNRYTCSMSEFQELKQAFANILK